MLSCLYGHEWEGCPGDNCPTCGSKGSIGKYVGHRVDTQFMEPHDIAMALEHKRDIEDNSDKVLSGQWSIPEKNLRIPKELRASLPDSFKRFSR